MGAPTPGLLSPRPHSHRVPPGQGCLLRWGGGKRGSPSVWRAGFTGSPFGENLKKNPLLTDQTATVSNKRLDRRRHVIATAQEENGFLWTKRPTLG